MTTKRIIRIAATLLLACTTTAAVAVDDEPYVIGLWGDLPY